MIFRKHLPRQLEINKFLESLKRKAIHDYDIQIIITELSAEYEKSPFLKDIYKYIIKGHHIHSQIRDHVLRKLKTECKDYLVIDDVLFRIKVPKDKSIEPHCFWSYQKPMFLQSYIMIHCLQDIKMLLECI